MEIQQIAMIFAGIICLLYATLQIMNRSYLRREGFQAGDEEPLRETPQPSCRTPKKEDKVIMEYVSTPSAKDAILDVDDYEQNMVFQNEGDRELSTALRNKLMSQYPMDWSGQPPSSAQFQAGLRESFENATPTVPEEPKAQGNISGEGMQPPDTSVLEMEERKILQTQVPKKGGEDMTKQDVDDAKELIRQVQDKKGLIPQVLHQEGTNVQEVVGVRKKDEKILQEDEEAPASKAPVTKAGESTISVPPSAVDMAAATDPYQDTMKPQKVRDERWNQESWTPGLERMFAPTNPKVNWQ